MGTKVITGISIPVALAVIFYLTDVPAWAWAFLAVVVIIDAAMILRAHRADARR